MTKFVAEKIFNNDSNISTPGMEKETRTGLGLIIYKEFISKHGGFIRVESEIGKGSRFIAVQPYSTPRRKSIK